MLGTEYSVRLVAQPGIKPYIPQPHAVTTGIIGSDGIDHQAAQWKVANFDRSLTINILTYETYHFIRTEFIAAGVFCL